MEAGEFQPPSAPIRLSNPVVFTDDGTIAAVLAVAPIFLRPDFFQPVEHARAAGGAFFRPDASFFEDADKGRIEARVNGFAGITLGNSAG